MKLGGILRKKNGKFITIDFGESFIKIAHMEAQAPDFKLLKYEVSLTASEEEKKEEEAVDFVKNFLKKNSIPDKDVYLSISDSDAIIIKYLSLPILPEEEILEAAKWQLKEEIPFDMQDAVFDWEAVREYSDEEGVKKNGIIFIAARKNAVNKYVAIAYKCGLEPIGVTSGHFSYQNLLAYYPKNFPVCAILDIGYKDSSLCIYNNNKLNFVRQLAFSSEKLTQSLTGSLVSEKGKTELSPEEAEKIKIAFGIPLDITLAAGSNIQANQIVSLMRHLLEGLVRELKFSFEYYAANFNAEHAGLLYITGGGSGLKNLDTYLHRELSITVTHLPLPECIKTDNLAKDNFDKDRNQIVNSVGAGLGGGCAINILPPEIKARETELFLKNSLKLISFTAAAVFLILFFIARFQVYIYRSKLKQSGHYLEAIKEIKDLKQKISVRDNLSNKIQGNNVPVDGLLKYISALIPQEIILDELSFDQESRRLVLKGMVSASENNAETLLINFIQKLEKTPFFTEAGLVSSKSTEAGQVFEISCRLATG